MSERHLDQHQTLYSFLERVLVRCPRCQERAEIRRTPERLVCGSCGYVKEGAQWSVLGGPTSEGFELWLQTPCCGEILWAFNFAHLALLESYVAANLRERRIETGCDNRSLAGRLPRWMTSTKNRETVLGAIEWLKQLN